jgi:hypothetical protein
MSKRNGFNKNLTIVKRVERDEIHFDYYPNERVAQSWVDTFNHGNVTGHAKIIDSDNAPRDNNADDTVRL